METGVLYVVATPIGNLEDITPRALTALRGVDMILAEDTRRSARLLKAYGIGKPLQAFHDHNEQRMVQKIVARLDSGESIALISDAGTPLISDPGYHLVRSLQETGHKVVPIPGACALVCALSVAGLPTDRFVFEGFLPAKEQARRRRLGQLAREPRTLIFYESPHRIGAALRDLVAVFGEDRQAAITRELTKVFETIRTGHLGTLEAWLEESHEHRMGEFVVIVEGAPEEEAQAGLQAEEVLRVLLEELTLKKAVSVAARLTGQKKNWLYRQAVALLEKE